jgi:hypothetical protein
VTGSASVCTRMTRWPAVLVYSSAACGDEKVKGEAGRVRVGVRREARLAVAS